MDFPAAPTSSSNVALRRAAAAAAILAFAVYAAVLVTHVEALAGGSDSSGYMNHARLLASGSLHVQPRTIPGLPRIRDVPMLYVPLGFRPAWNGDGIVPTYPVGFSLFIVALKPLAGWRHAGDLAIILHSLGGLAATYALGRLLGLGRLWSALSVAILALSPLYIFMSLQAMSDVPSLLWTTLAVLAAIKSRETPSWAVAAGAAVAVDVLLRPTNLLVLAPLAVALGPSPRRWLLLGLGGLPGAVFFFAHSLAAYGRFGATGYGDTSLYFSSGLVPGTLLHYARWLPVLFTPAVALDLALPWVPAESPRTRWLLGTWIVAFAGFYATYACTHETWWYLRYLLPAAPALLVGALLVLRAALSRAPAWADPGRSPIAFALGLGLVAASLAGPNNSLHPFSVGREEARYRTLTGWMQGNLPKDAVCFAMQTSGAIFHDTGFTLVRWDMMREEDVGPVDSAARAAGRPLYAVLFPFEVDRFGALWKGRPGHWIEIGKVEDVTVLRRDPDAAKP